MPVSVGAFFRQRQRSGSGFRHRTGRLRHRHCTWDALNLNIRGWPAFGHIQLWPERPTLNNHSTSPGLRQRHVRGSERWLGKSGVAHRRADGSDPSHDSGSTGNEPGMHGNSGSEPACLQVKSLPSSCRLSARKMPKSKGSC